MIDYDRESVLDEPIQIDRNHSIKLKRLPECLEDVRHKDPQGTIDYIFGRKEVYKKNAKKQAENFLLAKRESKLFQEQLIEIEKKLARYRIKLKEETAMKNWWKYACTISIVISFVLCILTFFLVVHSFAKQELNSPRLPTSGTVQKSSASVLASVNIYNGSIQGSGTIISKGPTKALLLSAAHNFQNEVGSRFWVYYVDGTYTVGTLIAIDHQRDLAVAWVPSETIIDRSHIPSKISQQGILSGVGYTGGQGPNYRELSFNNCVVNHYNKSMWNFSVVKGPFWDGDSGGGVFADDALIGVTVERDKYRNQCNRLYSISHQEILNFLNENKSQLKDCGDYMQSSPVQVAKINSPPSWSPKPNVPIFLDNPLEKQINVLQQEISLIKLGLSKPIINEKKKSPEDSLLKKPSEIE